MTEGITIDEVVVSAEKEERARNVEGTQMGTVSLPVENIKKLPAIFGEVDLLKSIQLLPGVLSSGEGNAGFYVRGGEGGSGPGFCLKLFKFILNKFEVNKKKNTFFIV